MLKANNDVCDYIWQSSRFDGELLFSVLTLYQRGEFFCAVFLLLSILEKICSRVAEDYYSNYQSVLKNLFVKKMISKVMHQYLNDNNQASIRDIRNIMTHKDVYSYIVLEHKGKGESVYPLSEADFWKAFYDRNANVLFNIIYELVFGDDNTSKEIDDYLSKYNSSCLNLMVGSCHSNLKLLH